MIILSSDIVYILNVKNLKYELEQFLFFFFISDLFKKM